MAGEPQDDCLFCKIVAGQIPATIVRETDTTVAFRDINPQAPTHVLVIPKAHHKDAAALAAEAPQLAADVLRETQAVADDEKLDSYRTVFNTGSGAGQTVWHAHAHVLGGRGLEWPPDNPDRTGPPPTMSVRELVVLGTASQVPTRHRNHNGYLLRWDGEGILFDPGEGTQRQMLRAGVAAHDLNRICVTHFHGDHSLGLAGVIQRINLDRVPHEITAHYPRSGQRFFERLRYATAYRETVALTEVPVAADGPLAVTPAYTLDARRLSHPVESYGYRLTEPDGRRMLPERLAAHGITGPDVGRIQRDGSLGGVALDEVSEVRRGQRFAFVMDTRLCEGVHALAEDSDLLVIESTFLDEDETLATDHGHLTAGQAARVARDAGVRHLVLTHFSQRYSDPEEFERQARAAGYAGELTVARDLTRVPVPKRR